MQTNDSPQKSAPSALLSAQISLDSDASVTVKQAEGGVVLRLHQNKRTMAVELTSLEVDALVDALGILS